MSILEEELLAEVQEKERKRLCGMVLENAINSSEFCNFQFHMSDLKLSPDRIMDGSCLLRLLIDGMIKSREQGLLRKAVKELLTNMRKEAQ
jgi:hypothetical protein